MLRRLIFALPRALIKATAALRGAGLRSLVRLCRILTGPDLPSLLAQIARLQRTRQIGEKISEETVYLITSLPQDSTDPQRLLDLARAHWTIENRLHYVRDISMNEDRCRVRAGARPLAGVRNAALALIRARGLPIREARENFREDRHDAIQTVTGRIL